MPIEINNPLNDINPGDEELEFMRNLQANILKGHGREHVALLFLAVNKKDLARSFLQQFQVTTALEQLEATKEFKRTGTPGGLIRLAFLSKAGLDVFERGTPFGGLFAAGMAADADVLDMGTTESWQDQLKQRTDVLLLLAHESVDELAKVLAALTKEFEATESFSVIFVQAGNALKNSDSEGIEHFGYVDGRSQPLMLESDIRTERKLKGGIDHYDPSAPLSQFIVQDPLDAGGFGSFFVFRKLEQNVAGFKHREDLLANEMHLTKAQSERAGAQVVGRFEDGTPVTQFAEEDGVPVPNNFNYDQDRGGAKCPFQGHIRKTNPRGASPGGLDFDKRVQMARRGITYGARLQHPVSKALIDEPNDGVGLLFMSYQASIEQQFHFMQSSWANDHNFPDDNVGIDPVIGQGTVLPQRWFPKYDDIGTPEKEFAFGGFVKLKGGDYFYAPSINGLRNL